MILVYSMNAPDMWHLTIVQIIEGNVCHNLQGKLIFYYKFSKDIETWLVYFEDRKSLTGLITQYWEL